MAIYRPSSDKKGYRIGQKGVKLQDRWRRYKFDMTTVFAAGGRGFAFAPWQLNTLFQEITGAAAVTPAVVNGPVGTMKSLVNGWYAVAPNNGARGILRYSMGKYWIEFSTSAYMISGLTLGTTQYEWVATDQGASAFMMEHSPDTNVNDGSYFYGTGNSSWQVRHGGTTQSAGGTNLWANGLHLNERQYIATVGGIYMRDTVVLSNGSMGGLVVGEADATANYYIGARAGTSLFFVGKYYGHALLSATPSDKDRASMRKFLGSKMGLKF